MVSSFKPSGIKKPTINDSYIVNNSCSEISYTVNFVGGGSSMGTLCQNAPTLYFNDKISSATICNTAGTPSCNSASANNFGVFVCSICATPCPGLVCQFSTINFDLDPTTNTPQALVVNY